MRKWFPNILMMFDAYHLIYAKNGKSVMAKDFGPVCVCVFVWSDLREYSIKALEADDKDGFLVSVSSNLKMCSMDVCAVLTFCCVFFPLSDTSMMH